MFCQLFIHIHFIHLNYTFLISIAHYFNHKLMLTIRQPKKQFTTQCILIYLNQPRVKYNQFLKRSQIKLFTLTSHFIFFQIFTSMKVVFKEFICWSCYLETKIPSKLSNSKLIYFYTLCFMIINQSKQNSSFPMLPMFKTFY